MPLPNNRATGALATYSVWADRAPDVVSRIAGLFAQHNLVPDLFRSRALGDQLQLSVRLTDIEESRAQVIAAKIDALVNVQMCRLELTLSRRALSAAA